MPWRRGDRTVRWSAPDPMCPREVEPDLASGDRHVGQRRCRDRLVAPGQRETPGAPAPEPQVGEPRVLDGQGAVLDPHVGPAVGRISVGVVGGGVPRLDDDRLAAGPGHGDVAAPRHQAREPMGTAGEAQGGARRVDDERSVAAHRHRSGDQDHGGGDASRRVGPDQVRERVRRRAGAEHQRARDPGAAAGVAQARPAQPGVLGVEQTDLPRGVPERVRGRGPCATARPGRPGRRRRIRPAGVLATPHQRDRERRPGEDGDREQPHHPPSPTRHRVAALDGGRSGVAHAVALARLASLWPSPPTESAVRVSQPCLFMVKNA